MKEFVENNSSTTLISMSFKNTKEKMKFKCACGEDFSTTFEKFNIRNKRKCNTCSYNEIRNYNLFTINEVKEYVAENSKCELISNEYVNGEYLLDFKCACGEKFTISFFKFKQRKSKTCLRCSNYTSNGENIIEDLFKKYGINYRTQYKFNNLKADNNKHRLRFDFAVLDSEDNAKILIEFDGKQHFSPIDYFGGKSAFLQLKANDKKKECYCLEKNISLIRIPYFDIDSIENILINKNVISHHIAS